MPAFDSSVMPLLSLLRVLPSFLLSSSLVYRYSEMESPPSSLQLLSVDATQVVGCVHLLCPLAIFSLGRSGNGTMPGRARARPVLGTDVPCLTRHILFLGRACPRQGTCVRTLVRARPVSMCRARV